MILSTSYFLFHRQLAVANLVAVAKVLAEALAEAEEVAEAVPAAVVEVVAEAMAEAVTNPAFWLPCGYGQR